MDRVNLSSLQERIALIEQVFSYPERPHTRKHGPKGYGNYESYREWLRDEFSYRCVFSLLREKWGYSFHIDHLIPQSKRADLICDYENLIYIEVNLNLRKNNKYLPDPCQVALGQHLLVHTTGDRIGEIEAKRLSL